MNKKILFNLIGIFVSGLALASSNFSTNQQIQQLEPNFTQQLPAANKENFLGDIAPPPPPPPSNVASTFQSAKAVIPVAKTEPIDQELDKIERGKRAKLVNELMDINYETKLPPKQLYDRPDTKANKHLPPVYFKSYYLYLAFQAVERNNSQELRAVLSKFDFRNGQNIEGDTVLMYAIEYQNLDIARILLAKGANVNAVNNRKRTALHYAATLGDMEAIKLLLTMGADMTLTDDRGKTPVDYARINNHLDAMMLMINYAE